jgi:hypothetical protein
MALAPPPDADDLLEPGPDPGTEPVHEPDGHVLVGWREWVGLPSLGIEAIKAKTDTGARTSALHAERIERFSAGGRPMLAFRVLPFRGDRVTHVDVETELIDERLVRSSDGEAQLRPVIRASLAIAGLERSIELSLARRDLMGFRMLLGRGALEGMLVDPSRSYLWGAFEPPIPLRPSAYPPPVRTPPARDAAPPADEG